MIGEDNETGDHGGSFEEEEVLTNEYLVERLSIKRKYLETVGDEINIVFFSTKYSSLRNLINIIKETTPAGKSVKCVAFLPAITIDGVNVLRSGGDLDQYLGQHGNKLTVSTVLWEDLSDKTRIFEADEESVDRFIAMVVPYLYLSSDLIAEALREFRKKLFPNLLVDLEAKAGFMQDEIFFSSDPSVLIQKYLGILAAEQIEVKEKVINVFLSRLSETRSGEMNASVLAEMVLAYDSACPDLIPLKLVEGAEILLSEAIRILKDDGMQISDRWDKKWVKRIMARYSRVNVPEE